MAADTACAPTLRVGVVGAGVAGLTCARELQRAGADVEVFEAGGSVGGRVQTDDFEGYQLDRGFQILITSYPEVRRQLDLPALGLRNFAPGAVLADSGRLSVVAHPLKYPAGLWQTFRTALGWGFLRSCLDVMSLLCLALGWLVTSPRAVLRSRNTDESTASFLRRKLSPTIVRSFLQPFFEAIYVSRIEEQSASLFQFVLRMLATGDAALPRRGMRAVPEQLAAELHSSVRLNTAVEAVLPDALQVGGEWRRYDAVVVAADGPHAEKLLNLPPAKGTSSSTWYFGLSAPAPVREPLIVLQSYGRGSHSESEAGANSGSRVVNIGFPSVVQPSYAPAGKVLAAVTIMGPVVTEAWVREEVERILGVDVSSWRLLRHCQISYHQPAQSPPQRPEVAVPEVGGVFCCGDHRAFPTLDGAMLSGRYAAEAVLKARRTR